MGATWDETTVTTDGSEALLVTTAVRQAVPHGVRRRATTTIALPPQRCRQAKNRRSSLPDVPFEPLDEGVERDTATRTRAEVFMHRHPGIELQRELGR